MENPTDNEKKLAYLIEENQRLQIEIKGLRDRLSFLEKHPTLAAGMQGERIVSELLDGKLTGHVVPHDFVSANGTLIEVKYAKLSVAVRDVPTRRWAWAKIFGEQGAKRYDYLLLVGETDSTFCHLYNDPECPYIFFLIPYNEVQRLVVQTGRHRAIQLTTNPRKAKSVASPLFKQYQRSIGELRSFGL